MGLLLLLKLPTPKMQNPPYFVAQTGVRLCSEGFLDSLVSPVQSLAVECNQQRLTDLLTEAGDGTFGLDVTPDHHLDLESGSAGITTRLTLYHI